MIIMVEKIIINGKVRALGNIVEEKTVDDYLTYYSTLSKTTDTVDGTSMDVYIACDGCNCLFYDKGVTSNKNTDWFIRSSDTSNLSVTVTQNGTTLNNTSTETVSRYYFANPEHSTSNTPQISLSGDFVIECDILSHEITGSSQIAIALQGLSPAYNISTLTAPFHAKIIKEGTNVSLYYNSTLWKTATITQRSSYYMGFQLYNEGTVTFCNYCVREL